MKKKFLFSLFALLAGVGSILLVPTPTQAAGTPLCESSDNPLKITRWCENITQEELDCHDTHNPGEGADCMSNYIRKFALNIGQIIGDVGAYVAVVLAMYGGFLYMTSAGDPGKAVKGRKTIINSCIGIVITKVSSLALKTISDFTSRLGDKSVGKIASEVVSEMLFWGGAICVIMILWGGFQYTTSAGDPGKAAKARQTLLYAVVGLVLMIVAAVIINFAVNTFK